MLGSRAERGAAGLSVQTGLESCVWIKPHDAGSPGTNPALMRVCTCRPTHPPTGRPTDRPTGCKRRQKNSKTHSHADTRQGVKMTHTIMRTDKHTHTHTHTVILVKDIITHVLYIF